MSSREVGGADSDSKTDAEWFFLAVVLFDGFILMVLFPGFDPQTAGVGEDKNLGEHAVYDFMVL